MEEPKELFCNRLRTILHNKGWSQKVLSERTGIKYQHIHKVLNGKIQNPSLSVILRLGEALDISYDEILTNVIDPVKK